jgi:hypothetical protein
LLHVVSCSAPGFDADRPLLLDSTHKNWFLFTLALALAVVGLYGWLWFSSAVPLTGGSVIGIWYGLIGSALMIYAGLLSALRHVPSWWWLGSRKVWLRGHIWLGLLSGVFILCHSGFRWGSGVAFILSIVLILTLVTGIVGLFLQNVLPRMIMVRVPNEAPYEQIPHLIGVMRRQADELIDKVKEDKAIDSAVKIKLAEFYVEQVRPFLTHPYRRSLNLASPLQEETLFARVQALPGFGAVKDQLVELRGYCHERRLLADQQRMYHWLHGWLLVHVPLSVLLLVLGLAHAVMSLYYS